MDKKKKRMYQLTWRAKKKIYFLKKRSERILQVYPEDTEFALKNKQIKLLISEYQFVIQKLLFSK